MLLGKEKTTQDYIIERLSSGSQNIEALHQYILLFKKITRPAIYDQLKKLIIDEIIIKNKTRYILSNEWKENIANIFRFTDAPILHKGESTTYVFKSIEQMDQYWKHIFPIYSSLYKNEAIYMYDQHCFWIHMHDRHRSEYEHYKSYQKKKQRAYFLIGGIEELDFDFKRKYENKYLKINCLETKTFKASDHITVMGDIVINSKTPIAFSKKIQEIYKDKKISKKEKIEHIRREVKKIKKVSFKIEHNKKKAEKLKKILGKDFYILKR